MRPDEFAIVWEHVGWGPQYQGGWSQNEHFIRQIVGRAAARPFHGLKPLYLLRVRWK